MREIKFRAWLMTEQEWFYFGIEGIHRGVESDIDYTLVHQYTGLKDKNDVEIYEGDIVTYRDMYTQDKIRVIQWNELLARFEAYHDSNYTAMDTWFEVIGNIYENPELLEIEL